MEHLVDLCEFLLYLQQLLDFVLNLVKVEVGRLYSKKIFDLPSLRFQLVDNRLDVDL